MVNEIYVGDTPEIRLDTLLTDLADASKTSFKVLDPTGVATEWDASQYGETTKLYHQVTDELDVDGTWLLQAYVEYGTEKHRGKTVALEVYKVFEIS